MAFAREEAYRRLAEEATTAQQQTAKRLEQIESELTAIKERTAEMRRVLTEVEEPWSR